MRKRPRAAVLLLLMCCPALAFEPVLDHRVQPDQSSWSQARKDGYERARGAIRESPQAILHLPTLGLTIPVYTGTGKLALEAGAGWVESTSPPGGPGNSAIAGHRDGFFSPLRNVVLGDLVVLRVGTEERRHRVTSIRIVDALNVAPLAPTQSPTITLITCHPFDYKGYAPDRYIVRAELAE